MSFNLTLFIGCLLLTLCLTACSEEGIEGQFKGFKINTTDSTYYDARADLCSLSIVDERYFFRSNTKTIEKGQISMDASILYLKDTLRNMAEKKIAWKSTGKDTIVLTMNQDGKALELHMSRIP